MKLPALERVSLCYKGLSLQSHDYTIRTLSSSVAFNAIRGKWVPESIPVIPVLPCLDGISPQFTLLNWYTINVAILTLSRCTSSGSAVFIFYW